MNKTPPKRIVISGWYGNKNLGDEAQLSAIIGMIRCVLPNTKITVFSDDPEATTSEHHVNSVFRRKGGQSRLRRLSELFKADLFILGGGTLLYDTGIGADHMVWLNDVIMAKLMGRPFMFFNGGVGLIYNRLSKYCMKYVCDAMDLITVRDELSERNLRSLGITKPIYIGADSTFGLTERLVAGVKKYERYTQAEKPKVGINVRYWIYKLEEIPQKNRVLCEKFGGSSSDFANFRKEIAGTIDYLKQKWGAAIFFFPMSFLKAKDDYDVELSEEIAHLSSDWNDITVIRNECRHLEMINNVREIDVMIGMRLHALVFAAMLNIPILAISYDPKVDAFMKLIGQEEYLVNMNEVTREVLCKKIDELWEHREVIKKQLEERVSRLASESKKSAQLMYALLSARKSKIKSVFVGITLLMRVMPCIFLNIFDRSIQRPLGVIRHISSLPFCLKISFLLQTLRLKVSKLLSG